MYYFTMLSSLLVQCTLDLVTVNLVTTCDSVTIFQKTFLIYYIKSFDLETVFAETKSVTKLRLHCGNEMGIDTTLLFVNM
jgi:hypothetical protein